MISLVKPSFLCHLIGFLPRVSSGPLGSRHQEGMGEQETYWDIARSEQGGKESCQTGRLPSGRGGKKENGGEEAPAASEALRKAGCVNEQSSGRKSPARGVRLPRDRPASLKVSVAVAAPQQRGSETACCFRHWSGPFPGPCITRAAASVRWELSDVTPAASTVACLPSMLADQRRLRPLHSQGVLTFLSETLFLFGASHSPALRPESKDPTPFRGLQRIASTSPGMRVKFDSWTCWVKFSGRGGRSPPHNPSPPGPSPTPGLYML